MKTPEETMILDLIGRYMWEHQIKSIRKTTGLSGPDSFETPFMSLTLEKR